MYRTSMGNLDLAHKHHIDFLISLRTPPKLFRKKHYNSRPMSLGEWPQPS